MSEIALDQAENAAQYLHNIASLLPTSPTASILKSYYLTKCRKQTLKGPVGLPQQFFKSTKRCPRCCVQYEGESPSFQIMPERRKNRFLRRLLRKNAGQENLNSFQRAYCKNFAAKGNINAHNRLAVTCGICKNTTVKKLEKPKPLVVSPVTTTISKGKKKKKDRFSGLNKDVVLSMTPLRKPRNDLKLTLQSTPVPTKDVVNERKGNSSKKKLKKGNINNSDSNINVKLVKSKHKQVKAKEKQKQKLKGLQDILNKSKKKSNSATLLKQFLTDL